MYYEPAAILVFRKSSVTYILFLIQGKKEKERNRKREREREKRRRKERQK